MRHPARWVAAFVVALALGLQPVRAREDLIARCGAYAATHEALPLMKWTGSFQDPETNVLLADIASGDVERVLASSNPKVRTLGALALSVGDEPSRLRSI